MGSTCSSPAAAALAVTTVQTQCTERAKQQQQQQHSPKSELFSWLTNKTGSTGSSPSTEEKVLQTEEQMQAMEVAMAYGKAWKELDCAKAIALSTSDCLYHLKGMMEMPLRDFGPAMDSVVASFPDMSFNWDRIELAEDITISDDGAMNPIRFVNWTSAGHHTGEPFAFGPYPSIPARGTAVIDTVMILLWIKDNKIVRVEATSESELTGPGNLYSQIGGTMF